jgi:hypothetical protein
MAREHSQAYGLALNHPGATGKADCWHAADPYFNPHPAERPSNRRAHVAAPLLQDTESKLSYFTTKAPKLQMKKSRRGGRAAVCTAALLDFRLFSPGFHLTRRLSSLVKFFT